MVASANLSGTNNFWINPACVLATQKTVVLGPQKLLFNNLNCAFIYLFKLFLILFTQGTSNQNIKHTHWTSQDESMYTHTHTHTKHKADWKNRLRLILSDWILARSPKGCESPLRSCALLNGSIVAYLILGTSKPAVTPQLCAFSETEVLVTRAALNTWDTQLLSSATCGFHFAAVDTLRQENPFCLILNGMLTAHISHPWLTGHQAAIRYVASEKWACWICPISALFLEPRLKWQLDLILIQRCTTYFTVKNTKRFMNTLLSLMFIIISLAFSYSSVWLVGRLGLICL